MEIECNDDYAEYILPCAVNVLFEDDIIIEFAIIRHYCVSMVYLFIDLVQLF